MPFKLFEFGAALFFAQLPPLVSPVQVVELSNPSGETVRAIVYGNKTYGYYGTMDFSRVGDKIVADIVPPGYRDSFDFFLATDTGLEEKKSVSWKNPYRNLGPVRPLSRGFYIMTGYSNEGILQACALNHLGEFVWVYRPKLTTEENRGARVEPLGNSLFAIGSHGLNTFHFEAVDIKGNKTFEFNDSTERIMVPHHEYRFDGKSVTTFGTEVRAYDGELYLGDTIQSINLTSGEHAVRWRLFSEFNPLTDPDWAPQEKKTINISRYVRAPSDRKGYDFSHSNSLNLFPQGYLLSIRSLNKIVLLDKELKKILWTIGKSAQNTFRSDSFASQHHATLVSENRILLFDNGLASNSRILELQLFAKEGRAKVLNYFIPEGTVRSPGGGSAFVLENGNVLGFFPNSPTDLLIEFHKTTRREVARWTLAMDVAEDKFGSGRIYPSSSLGKEKFLGKTLAEVLSSGLFQYAKRLN